MAPVPGRTLRCPAKVDSSFAIGSMLRLQVPRVRMAHRAMFKRDSQNRVLVDINQLVREVLVLVQGERFKRGISLDTELTKNLPQVMAERVQLQQVVMNLVTNAMDAMEKPGHQ